LLSLALFDEQMDIAGALAARRTGTGDFADLPDRAGAGFDCFEDRATRDGFTKADPHCFTVAPGCASVPAAGQLGLILNPAKGPSVPGRCPVSAAP
jgi:hypothetical protein